MSEISELEEQIEKCKKQVAFGEALKKLTSNREFRKVILEEFCVNEAARYVQTSVNPAIDAEGRESALRIAQASGHLKQWLHIQELMAEQAKKDMVGAQDAIDSIRAEGDDK